MAIGTHFIVYERAVGAGPRDGGAAIGKWRDEEAGHNSMEPGGGIWWHHGHTIAYRLPMLLLGSEPTQQKAYMYYH